MGKFFNIKGTTLLILLVALFNINVYAQAVKLGGLGEVSEIIIPGAATMQNNNMYYEVHLMNTDYPSPSFWYKIIFAQPCQFEFTLFPIGEDDGYDFYFFKVADNMDFCDAIQADKLVSCNSARIYKQYSDDQSESNSKLSNIKAISVEKNDAIYIEVFGTVGNDCGHILDFRTTSTSFVIKVVNDKCKNGHYTSEYEQAQYTPVFTAKEATRIFSNTVCYLDEGPTVSIIKAQDDKVIIRKDVDFYKYSKDEAYKYVTEKKDTVLAPKNTIDSTTLANIYNLNKDTTIAEKPYKSTSDLETPKEVESPTISHEIVNIKSRKEKNATRLDVDKVLFSLLKEDLKRRIESNRKQTKDYYDLYKKAKSKQERDEIKTSISELKLHKETLIVKSKETKIKLKKIQKLLSENKKTGEDKESTVFTNSIYSDNASTQNIVNCETTDEIIENPKLPEGLVYMIQVGVYRNKISKDIFKGLSPVTSLTFPGGVKYYVGAFRHYNDARNAKEYIKTMGLTDAFIVAYYNGERVVVKEAKMFEVQY